MIWLFVDMYKAEQRTAVTTPWNIAANLPTERNVPEIDERTLLVQIIDC